MEEQEEKFREHTGDPDGYFPFALMLPKCNKGYYLPFKYRKKKKDGSFTQKKFELNVTINYNPFTGEKL